MRGDKVFHRVVVGNNEHIGFHPLDHRQRLLGIRALVEVEVAERLALGGAERARFLRPAYYQLAPYLAADAAGEFALDLAGGPYRIARA